MKLQRISTSAITSIAIHAALIATLVAGFQRESKILQNVSFESPPIQSKGEPQKKSSSQAGVKPTAVATDKAETGTSSGAASLHLIDTSIGSTTYLQQLREKIESRIHFPLSLQRRGVQGTVILKFTLGEGAKVESENSELVQLVLHAFSDAQPLPPAPPGFSPKRTIEIPIEFRSKH